MAVCAGGGGPQQESTGLDVESAYGTGFMGELKGKVGGRDFGAVKAIRSDGGIVTYNDHNMTGVFSCHRDNDRNGCIVFVYNH